MTEFNHPFLNLVFISIIALFPVINPVGSALIISPYFAELTSAEKRTAVGKITVYAFLICFVSVFAGHWILALFGLSIPVIRLAGGIMICKMGWEFLASDPGVALAPKNTDVVKPSGYNHIAGKLFYPITFPVTTGAGTISVLFTLSAHGESGSTYYLNIMAILAGVLVMCALIYIFYLNTRTIIRFLGSGGETIVNRISAFLIFCVGLQIAVTGIKALFNM